MADEEQVNRPDIQALIQAVTGVAGDAIPERYTAFEQDLRTLLALRPADIADIRTYARALAHCFAYYFWKWDPRAIDILGDLRTALFNWSRSRTVDLDLLCDLIDFHYFVVWCFNGSNTEQCGLGKPGMQVVSASLAAMTASKRFATARSDPRPIKVAYLAMFASHGDPMSVALRHVTAALAGADGAFKLFVYAWRSADDRFLDWVRDQGVLCHRLNAESPTRTLDAIEQRLAEDVPDILITDMNNAIPTVLFSRRSAPVQVFLQAGMPVWPVRNLDAVFNSFGISPAIAGWGGAANLEFRPPWDIHTLAPPVDEDELSRERATLPQGYRLIGCYGRLVKITPDYLHAVERILEANLDVAFVTGGTGDAGLIKTFSAASPVGGRIHVETRFVPGHSWDHILDVFLDTAPLQGGEACRAAIAKGRPVVALHSDEMPALDLQRDPTMIASNWAEYAAIAIRLLQDRAAYDAACSASLALATHFANRAEFRRRIRTDLTALVRHRPAGLLAQAALAFREWRGMSRK